MPYARLLSRAACAALVASYYLAAGVVAAAQPAAATSSESAGPAAPAESPPPVARELRAAWIATVGNIDWPSRPGLSTVEQQAELVALLDRAAELKLNAVIFQVRPAADALYASRLEPWSEYLVGTQGVAPDPYYDPLAFAIEEAHRRGLELHAWFNPYRARHASARSEPAATHVSRRHPELVRRYGPYLWMDPGDPAVRRLTRRVVLDVVRRYDVDGVHIDDYFYPYQENDAAGRLIPFPDDVTWRRYRRAGGRLSRDDWRRRNVDLLVRELYEAIKATKPWVKFGISPFGIWRPGSPPTIRGLDAYTELFADSRKWVRNGWLDYVAPQLYWSVDSLGQSFPLLLRWWTEQNVHGRHVWPGLFTSRVGAQSDRHWSTDEIVEQIRLTRAQPGASGDIHFSMKALMPAPEDPARDTLAGRLRDTLYAEPALVPASPWLRRARPPRPRIRVHADSLGGTVAELRPGGSARPWLWVVRSRTADAWTTTILPGEQLRHLLADAGAAAQPDVVVVSAIDRVGNESAPATYRLPERLLRVQKDSAGSQE